MSRDHNSASEPPAVMTGAEEPAERHNPSHRSVGILSPAQLRAQAVEEGAKANRAHALKDWRGVRFHIERARELTLLALKIEGAA